MYVLTVSTKTLMRNPLISFIEPLIDFAKECAKDPKVLSRLRMHRTTASYKLTYGVGKMFHENLLNKLRITPFSLNLDEATSSNQLHVLTVLVSYYNSEKKSIDVEHLGSIHVPTADAASLLEELKNMFAKNNLPWENLLAMLMDSAAPMRGKKTGLEVRVRELAPHLLDVDGDSCHHIHNVVKNFTKHFDRFLENLFRDIYTDFKHSADSLDCLKDIAFHMGLTFRKPSNYIAARWLSVFDTTISFDYMKDGYTIYYNGTLISQTEKAVAKTKAKLKKKKNDRELTLQLCQEEKELGKLKKRQESVLKSVSGFSKQELYTLQKKAARKSVRATKKGKKERSASSKKC